MGKVVEKKRKKKKGRPSLLDLQKRSLKQQQEQLQQQQLKSNHKTHKFRNPNPNPSPNLRRSTRRNPNPDSDDDNDLHPPPSAAKRREKKLKLVSKLSDDEQQQHEDDEQQEDEDEEPNSAQLQQDNNNSGSDSDPNQLGYSRKRKIDSIAPGSGFPNHDKGGEKLSVGANESSLHQGSKLDDGPSTPLPDKKLLLFILDRLQKKDTYGVFSEPVDPEELPDYHEVIEHPMDFSTIRKKLTDGAYGSLEEFEKDVFLICSNAMQYNSPDTVYFRQACSIQELAKKNFENLRQDSDDNEPEPEPKVVRRGRPPTKNIKRPPGRPPLERANSDFSEATLATAGGNTNRFNNEARKGLPVLEKHGSADLFARSLYGSRYGETYIGWSAERFDRTDDITGSALKGISMKHGKKQIVLDESRRTTYRQTYLFSCRQEPSVLTTFDGERKHLIPVGLHTEYGYARSLSRFAAKLGPVAWKVASRKIQRCIPKGVKFGPGWVGENEAPADRLIQQQLPGAVAQRLPPASLSTRGEDSSSAATQGKVESCGNKSSWNPKDEQSSEAPTSSQPKLDNGLSKEPCSSTPHNDANPVSSPLTTLSNGPGSKSSAPEASASFHPTTTFNMLNSSSGATRAGHPYQVHQVANNQSRINGLNGSYGLNFAAQMGKMIAAARPTMFNLQSSPAIVTVSRTENHNGCSSSGDNKGSGEAKSSENSSTIKSSDCLPNAGRHQNVGSAPPDLNVGFQSPGSPGSAKADSVQPDLALQL